MVSAFEKKVDTNNLWRIRIRASSDVLQFFAPIFVHWCVSRRLFWMSSSSRLALETRLLQRVSIAAHDCSGKMLSYVVLFDSSTNQHRSMVITRCRSNTKQTCIWSRHIKHAAETNQHTQADLRRRKYRSPKTLRHATHVGKRGENTHLSCNSRVWVCWRRLFAAAMCRLFTTENTIGRRSL